MRIEYTEDKFGKYVLIALNHQPSGGKTWLAEITGTDPKYKLKREFITAGDKDHSSSGKTGTDYWYLRQDGFFEYDEAWKDRGFFKIESGKLYHISKDEVIQTMKAREAGGQ